MNGAEDPSPILPRRLIGEVQYLLLLSAPRLIAEGIRAYLEARKIPVHLETPYTSFGLPEAYMGTYTGDVSLWVPEALYVQAVMVVERDQQGELS